MKPLTEVTWVIRVIKYKKIPTVLLSIYQYDTILSRRVQKKNLFNLNLNSLQ